MIPVSSCLLQGNEKKYLCQAIDDGEVSGSGRFVRTFEEQFAKWAGTKYAVAVCNGTAALETAIWANETKTISIPVGTIISCAISAYRAGVKIYFRDNVSDIFYRSAMRVHLFGKIDETRSVYTIDDCSQYWAKFNHQDISCYSLYANKLITAGEGGIIVTNFKKIYKRAKAYRNLCHSKERFIHNDIGYNFRMSNLQAAVALAQLEQIDKFTEIKQRNRNLYKKYMPDKVEIKFDVDVPWMYNVSTKYDAGKIVKKMMTKGVECRRFFYPLYRQPCLKGIAGSFPVADNLWKHSFYLPSGLSLTEKEIIWICKVLSSTLVSMTK